MRVLLVDDSRTARMQAREVLSSQGWTFFEAADGAEALGVLKVQPVDLVLADWEMPGMNGLDFVRALRRSPSWSALPVIMVTRQTEQARIAEALRAGANEYVMKPFAEDALLDKLRILGVLKE
jgi:two-component system chemotaxis response regulator CheY